MGLGAVFENARHGTSKNSENSRKPNIEFLTDFKADFVGFVQKPYRVGFFAYIKTFYEWRSIELTLNKNSYDSRNNTGSSQKQCRETALAQRHGRKSSRRSRKLNIRLRSVRKCRTYLKRLMTALEH